MKYLMIFFFVLFSQKNILESKAKYFHMTDVMENIGLNITLNTDNSYSMIFTIQSDDMVDHIPLSIGTYKIKKNKIIFTDEFFNFTNVGLLNNDITSKNKKSHEQIEIVKGFDWMEEKHSNFFTIIENNKDFDKKSIKKMLNNYKLQLEILDSISYYYKKCSFKTGIYSKFFFNANYFKIYINDDHSYKYFFNNKIVSNGTWKKSNNEIILHDKIFSKEYKLMIKEANQIVAVHLPLFYIEDIEFRTFKLETK